jgi:hypothetical protein
VCLESARIARCAGATLIVALGALGRPVHADSGSWSSHQIDFTFLGFTSTYSCEGLQTKLEALLRTLGARQDAAVRTAPCERGFGAPEKFASASLRFASLQPLEAAAGTAAAETDAAVAGQWRHVELAPHRPRELDLGDCELIEQFRDKILPSFATRALHNDVRCIPFQESGSAYTLQFDVFVPGKP